MDAILKLRRRTFNSFCGVTVFLAFLYVAFTLVVSMAGRMVTVYVISGVLTLFIDFIVSYSVMSQNRTLEDRIVVRATKRFSNQLDKAYEPFQEAGLEHRIRENYYKILVGTCVDGLNTGVPPSTVNHLLGSLHEGWSIQIVLKEESVSYNLLEQDPDEPYETEEIFSLKIT